MRLRPHHLLCTQSYSGKGYNDAFVKNMDQITEKLRTEAVTPVEITYSADDLCSCCPSLCSKEQTVCGKNSKICKDSEKVDRYDQKVVDYFNIEEKTYVYQDITRQIREQMTPEILRDICGDCEWYPISACRKVLAGEE